MHIYNISPVPLIVEFPTTNVKLYTIITNTFNGFSDQFQAELNAELRGIGVIFNTNTPSSDSMVVTGNSDAIIKLLVVQD